MTRPNQNEYFMHLAVVAATRSTCDRRHVGCVIVVNDRVVSTGYNGSLPGAPHCDDNGHMMVDGHCIRTVHAEANAVAHAARVGTQLNAGMAYVTVHPCPDCLKTLISAGMRTIVHLEPYHADKDAISSMIMKEHPWTTMRSYDGDRPWTRSIDH
jgi:dCMP deaminase